MRWDIQNPIHRRVLETARAWGVSPSRFMGIEPQIVRLDIDGQHVLRREPEWTQEDREAAIALISYEASLCSGCGHPLEETTSPEKEFAYKSELPIRCHYCTEAARGSEAYAESPQSEALHFPIKLREST